MHNQHDGSVDDATMQAQNDAFDDSMDVPIYVLPISGINSAVTTDVPGQAETCVPTADMVGEIGGHSDDCVPPSDMVGKICVQAHLTWFLN